eukprot:TRINITY_DN11341_c4_g1_i1.p1 TRINITY_DN11341_c4_g1~~TRINITY_DN11341_c4_g1_i1.p1  ORF type:complete len:120 (-),score=10.56 TRINITY_DN11341_c4_g1_i1:24-383(-)
MIWTGSLHGSWAYLTSTTSNLPCTGAQETPPSGGHHASHFASNIRRRTINLEPAAIIGHHCNKSGCMNCGLKAPTLRRGSYSEDPEMVQRFPHFNLADKVDLRRGRNGMIQGPSTCHAS